MKKFSWKRCSQIVSLVMGLSLANISLAMPILLEATLDGAQANAGAGTGSAGTGSASMMYDDSTGLFSWEIEWAGLTGPAIAAHFHGPATPTENGGVTVGFDHTSNPSIGSAVISAGQAADLLAGLWYINIHTIAFVPGEIRGQVERVDTAVPLPSSLALMMLALAIAGGKRRNRD